MNYLTTAAACLIGTVTGSLLAYGGFKTYRALQGLWFQYKLHREQPRASEGLFEEALRATVGEEARLSDSSDCPELAALIDSLEATSELQGRMKGAYEEAMAQIEEAKELDDLAKRMTILLPQPPEFFRMDN